MDRHARQLGEQGLRHATNFRVAWRPSGQRAAVAADNKGAVDLFDLREAAQLVEDTSGLL